MDKTKSKQTSEGIKKNQSLRKALQILEGMTKIQTPARLQDIAKSLKMPQSTLLRFLNTFIDFDYMEQDPATSCYYLTLKLADLGLRTQENFPFQSSLTKYVKQAAHTFNESASLCIEKDMQMLYIATEEGPGRMLQTLHRIGHIAPMHATGVGKLHLLNYSEAQLGELEKKRGLQKYTAHTITTLEALKKEITWIRKAGYAFDNEECEVGVKCIAVPVKNFQNQVVAGISVSAPITRLDKEKTEAIVRFLKEISLKASREMGCTQA
ncbi:IclR family transcriptional regulator [Leadbettera azotonutricia]|uniref:Transcriptional regulator n=1 Tax=Leadbettera azotonutricia (strain ATCC BAA-888 / DSM 13862 / ZAS-9) TaxID=545695 RepID=F5YGA5_LEAAZ|nr:IclR family transcriptional regulator [Leadbettera azotonutricia]AEF80428.1 transcriptional regulator [Leadbettera azotonutricia ZAS-9]